METLHVPFLNREILPLALGTWVLCGCFLGGVDEREVFKTIHESLDLGIRVIDTAPLYGFGNTEKILGRALRQDIRKDQVLICTKFGLGWKEKNLYRDARKKTVLSSAEESLTRLQIDCIDLYQLHWPDPLTPVAETAEALRLLLEEGKIKAVGLSNCTPDEIEAFQKELPIQALQLPFNLFEQEAKPGKIPILGFGTLCRGLLAGNMEKNPAFRGDDLRSFDPKFKEPLYSQYLNCVEALKKWVREKHHRSILDLAFRWTLDKGVIALWGPKNSSELYDIRNIQDWKLQPKDFLEIDAILKRFIPNPIGVEFLSPPLRVT